MKSLLKKVAVSLAILMMVFTTIFAISQAKGSEVKAGGGVNANLLFDASTNEFTVTADSGEDSYPLGYILAYSTPDQINGFVNFDETSFTHPNLYAGTCSGKVCNPDNVYRALLKVVVDFGDRSYWFTSKRYENGETFTLVMQDNGSNVFDLTDEEIAWLHGDEASPTPAPGDVCPNLDGTQTSMPNDYHYDASGVNCVQYQYGGAPTNSGDSKPNDSKTPAPKISNLGNKDFEKVLGETNEEQPTASPSATPETKEVKINVPSTSKSKFGFWLLIPVIPASSLLLFFFWKKNKKK
jgi:hypothetical protein